MSQDNQHMNLHHTVYVAQYNHEDLAVRYYTRNQKAYLGLKVVKRNILHDFAYLYTCKQKLSFLCLCFVLEVRTR